MINAGVPLHVVMRYFGHVSPEMTLHYAVTRSQTMEEEFLKYKKVTRDGRTAEIDGTDLYDLIQLDKRADRVLPMAGARFHRSSCATRGTPASPVPSSSLTSPTAPNCAANSKTRSAWWQAARRPSAPESGAPMGEDNVWLQGRQEEIGSLNRILLSITDITDRAVRGPGVADQPA